MSVEQEKSLMTLEKLEALLELRRVFFVESSSRRWNSGIGEEEVPPASTARDLQVMQTADEESISVRGRMIVKTPQAVLIADVVAVFSIEENDDDKNSGKIEEVELSADLMREFAERVAVPILFPFIRESIYGGARKIGVKPPVLGILRHGSVSLKKIPEPFGPSGDQR
ncbi:hypothetical protein [Streptosporangium sp. NPDC006007]|uniref:hypothetical protein n=1 Tax=Streptosporangium sp. NPDC006007 TaxID=3154575 RepID=UPI00339F32AF